MLFNIIIDICPIIPYNNNWHMPVTYLEAGNVDAPAVKEHEGVLELEE